MKKKRNIIILIIILLVMVTLFTIITISKKENNKPKSNNPISILSKEKEKEKNISSKVEQEEQKEEDITAEQKNNNTHESKTEKTVINNKNNESTANNNQKHNEQPQTTSEQNTNTNNNVRVEEKQKTEWEQLGISEYDYYNSPAPNEGELAFREIENKELHDEVVIESNKAEWREILSVYTVRISNGNKEQVMIIDQEKKKILKEVFWDLNTISSEVKTEEVVSRTIDSWDKKEFNNQDSNIKRVLHIYINHNPADTIVNKYKFNSIQQKQLKELLSDKYVMLWTSAIYGSYSSSGEYTDWKQRGKEWSNIRIGNSDRTIGQVGCLVTSIAILIKKSGVSTSNIVPFNPGTFVTALNNVYAFDGANLMYTPISKVVPNFQYGGKVYLTGKTKSEKLYEIKKYSENGYFIAIEVLGATDTAQHWVALDRVNNNTIIMIDPGSDSIDMWKTYDWNLTTQFVYFKVVQ